MDELEDQPSSTEYQLMEDGFGERCMTMPPLHPSSTTGSADTSRAAGKLPTRTATFTASTSGTATDEAADKLAAFRELVVTPKSTKSQPAPPAARRAGILRPISSLDSTSVDGEAPQRRRPKKQVCITLPGSSRPLISSRQPERTNESDTATSTDVDEGERPRGTVVEVEVHDNTRTDDEEETRESSAAGLLNGGQHVDGTQEQEIVFLRDRTQSRPSSMRQSMRQSLTNSLSRIGSRMRRGKPPKLQRLQSTLDFDALAQNELELKANLYWHIATPIKRWKVERQVPVKLVLQLLKTLLLIVQVVIFTSTISHKRGEFFFDSRIVFESIFVVDFDPEMALRERTLYSIQEVSRELEFIATNYYRLPEVVIGGYDLVRDEEGEPVPLQLSLRQYREASLNASGRQFVLDGHIDDLDFNFSRTLHSNITERLFEISQDPLFHKFLEMRVKMPVNVIRIEAPQQAECFRFNIQIVFVNDDHNGKILHNLGTDYSRIDNCRGQILRDKTSYKVIKAFLVLLDLIVLSFCHLSLFLTFKTLRRAYRLGKAMGQFYHHRLHLPLSWWERRSLFSTWHYVNILSDIIITAGTIYKILLEFDVVLDASAARILLGTALLFQSAVILRYLNYFRQVNALTRTLALAFPELVKFILCGAVLFFAFSLCGWIALGQFHPKFTTINDSIETLFSLLNGDDIYNTYILLEPQVDLAAYIYSRIFLYVFLALFVYGVLNLFTSLVISAHEISQNKDTAIGNEVRRFVFSGPLTPRGVALRDVTSTSKYVDPAIILNKAQRKRKHSSDDE